MPYKDPEAKRRWDRENVARRRAEWFAGKRCIRCGSTTDLQLDHCIPSTKVSHSVWAWSTARQDAELAKCQVLCKPCHRWKTVHGGEHAQGIQLGKLTEAEVTEARSLYAAGEMSFADLGRKYGVHRDTLRYAINRGGWKHLERPMGEVHRLENG